MRKSRVDQTEAGTDIRAEDGTVHHITAETMLAAMDRADKYLQEAVRWSEELAAHVEAGKGELDSRRHNRFLKRSKMPADVWFPFENAFTETDLMNVTATLHYWIEGTLEDFEEAYVTLEDGLDLDSTYILFGVPIRSLSVEAQDELCRVGARFASRALGALAARN
jgi:hypothetical protein